MNYRCLSNSKDLKDLELEEFQQRDFHTTFSKEYDYQQLYSVDLL